MQTLSPYLAEAVTAPLPHFALDVVAKATVLLLLAIAVAALLRRSSAALRHRLWRLTFAALILLPALSAVLPKWRLAVLPAAIQEDLAETKLGIRTTQESETATRSLVGPAELPLVGPTIHAARSSEEAMLENPAADLPAEERLLASDGEREPAPSADVRRQFALASIWLLGAAVALVPMIVGAARTSILRRRAIVIDDTAWNALLKDLCARLALSRRVELLETAAATMPMTWGLLRPVVLLPAQAHEWSASLRRVVLLHELAHVKRCDIGFQMLGRVTCALHWFHPLAWYALRRLRIERELACDDCVVLAGERASDYAAELLQIARTYRPVPLAAAVAMAQRSNLELRIRSMLDRACSHLPVSARAGRLLLTGVAVLATTVAAIRLAPRVAAHDESTRQVHAEPTPRRPAETESRESSAPRVVRGTVFDPDGQPLSGATVFVRTAIAGAEDKPLSTVTTDAAGHYEISFRWPALDDRIGAKPEMLVVAASDGGAADWQYLKQEASQEVALRLPAEKSIEGRIVNAEGKPLPNVELSVDEIERYERETMEQVLADVKAGRSILRMYKDWRYGPPPGQPAIVKTGVDGRFRMSGVSVNTVVKLHVRGAGIRHATLAATTAAASTIRGPAPPVDPPFPPQPGRVLYGSQFDYVAEPGRSIQGVVRDRASGRPVAGVKVRCWSATTAEAVTDAAGHYVLQGCGKQPEYLLSIEPPATGPAWFAASLPIADAPGLEPLVQDVELTEGIALSGKLVDGDTDRPLVADIEYAPILLNMHAASLFDQQAELNTHARSGPDGSFRIAVAPGPGALRIGFPSEAAEEYEAIGVTYDDVVKLFEQSPAHRALAHSPELTRGWPDALPTVRPSGSSLMGLNGARIVLISPDGQQRPAPLEVRLLRGRTLRGRLIDADGQPLAGATAYGLNNRTIASWRLPSADFTATALAPGETREIAFQHEPRKLGAYRKITGDELQPLAVLLEPAGSAKGRILDERGDPIEGMHVWFYRADDSLSEVFSITDSAGRFRVDNLIPGQPYEVNRSGPGGTSRLELLRDTFRVGSGQTHDLGDLTVKGRVQTVSRETPAAEEERAEAAASAAKAVVDDKNSNDDRSPETAANIVNLRGRVLDPDGKPLAGAKVYFWGPGLERDALKPQNETKADGRFQFSVDKSQLKSNFDDNPWSSAHVVAVADGYGYQRAEAAEPEADGQFVIRLVNDVPIRGRILSLEGAPIAKAKLTISDIDCYPHDRLDEYIDSRQTAGKPVRAARRDRVPPGQPDVVETDADGRFTLRGVGAERVVTLELEGPGIAKDRLFVMTRETEAIARPVDAEDRTLGAVFTYLGRPSRVIRGVVRDRSTKQPVSGVRISARGNTQLSARTDQAGRFELHGYPKSARYLLDAVCAGKSPYFSSSLTVDDSPGLDPIEVNFELAHGIEVAGRVTLAGPGQPRNVQVSYHPLKGNPYTDRIGPRLPFSCSSDRCDAEGRYALPVLPGPGILVYRIIGGWEPVYREYMAAALNAQDVDALYRSAGLQTPAGIADGRSVQVSLGGRASRSLSLLLCYKAALINPQDVETTLSRDVELSLGRTLDVKLIGPDGQSLAKTRVRGLTNDPFQVDELDKAKFTLVGLNPRLERQLIVESRKQKLAAYRAIRGEHTGPLTVRLEPCGTVVGRLLDAAGNPLNDTQVLLQRRGYLPADATATDRDGKFRINCIVPRLPYGLRLNLPGPPSRNRLIEGLVVKSGETKDLGDVRLKLPPGT